MILPIYSYGNSVLKKKAMPIDEDYPNLDELIENMWETMYNASGVGLAAPQVGLSIRLFIIDTVQMMDENEKDLGLKMTFINPEKVIEQGEPWAYEEGCLSIPDIRGEVMRPPLLKLRFLNENFEPQEQTFRGINARVIQHEYDHIEGVLFLDHLKPLKKRLIKKKLDYLKKGQVKVDYKMKFAVKK